MKTAKLIKNRKPIGLDGYLNGHALNLDLKLSRDESLSFNWSDWKETCTKQRIICQAGGKDQYLNMSIENFKEYPVWVRYQMNMIRCSLYELYMSYLDPRVRSIWYENPENGIQVSTVCETGPYIPITSMRWFVKEHFLTFVQRNIIDKKMPERNFRLKTQFEIPCRNYSSGYFSDSTMKLTQMTQNGFLVEFDSFNKLNEAFNCEKIEINFDSALLQNGIERSPSFAFDLFRDDPKALFNLKETSATYSITGKDLRQCIGSYDNHQFAELGHYFVFIPYSKFVQLEGKQSLFWTLSLFMKQTEILFGEELAAA